MKNISKPTQYLIHVLFCPVKKTKCPNFSSYLLSAVQTFRVVEAGAMVDDGSENSNESLSFPAMETICHTSAFSGTGGGFGFPGTLKLTLAVQVLSNSESTLHFCWLPCGVMRSESPFTVSDF